MAQSKSEFKAEFGIDLFLVFLVLFFAFFVFHIVIALDDEFNILKIRNSVELSMSSDVDGSALNSILNANINGKPVIEEIGDLTIKEDTESIKETLMSLFSSVYKGGFILEIFDSGKRILYLENGHLTGCKTTQVLIPKPGDFSQDLIMKVCT